MPKTLKNLGKLFETISQDIGPFCPPSKCEMIVYGVPFPSPSLEVAKKHKEAMQAPYPFNGYEVWVISHIAACALGVRHTQLFSDKKDQEAALERLSEMIEKAEKILDTKAECL